MDDLDEIIRRNPKAAAGVDAMKGAMEALQQLRDAGIARGAVPLLPPHGGRYAGIPRPARTFKVRARISK